MHLSLKLYALSLGTDLIGNFDSPREDINDHPCSSFSHHATSRMGGLFIQTMWSMLIMAEMDHFIVSTLLLGQFQMCVQSKNDQNEMDRRMNAKTMLKTKTVMTGWKSQHCNVRIC